MRDLDGEVRLHFRQHLLVRSGAYKGDREALGSEPSGPGNPVKVQLGIGGHVVVDHDVDAFDVDPPSDQVSGHHDAGLEFLEFLVGLDSFGLFHARVKAGAREVAFDEELGEFHSARHGGHEDDELVELERVQEVDQFPVLVFFLEGDGVLLEPVERELGSLVDVDLEWL